MYGYYNLQTTRRTKTYIAGDWTGDKDAIDQLYKWKENSHLSLDFFDAHEMTQSRDTSLNCSIKASLKTRLDASKIFVLIVGEGTKNLRSGGCSYCSSYHNYICRRGHSVDNRSYVDYECEKAIEAKMKIVVLYNSTKVDREKCPDVLKYKGEHVAMAYRSTDGKVFWDYQAVKAAIE